MWGCILRTDPAQWDLRSFYSELLSSLPPPKSVSGVDCHIDFWKFPQEVWKLWCGFSLLALEHLALNTAVREAPHQPCLHSVRMQKQWVHCSFLSFILFSCCFRSVRVSENLIINCLISITSVCNVWRYYIWKGTWIFLNRVELNHLIPS